MKTLGKFLIKPTFSLWRLALSSFRLLLLTVELLEPKLGADKTDRGCSSILDLTCIEKWPIRQELILYVATNLIYVDISLSLSLSLSLSISLSNTHTQTHTHTQ